MEKVGLIKNFAFWKRVNWAQNTKVKPFLNVVVFYPEIHFCGVGNIAMIFRPCWPENVVYEKRPEEQ